MFVMRILKAFDVTLNFLKVIETMYEGTQAKLVNPDGESE